MKTLQFSITDLIISDKENSLFLSGIKSIMPDDTIIFKLSKINNCPVVYILNSNSEYLTENRKKNFLFFSKKSCKNNRLNALDLFCYDTITYQLVSQF